MKHTKITSSEQPSKRTPAKNPDSRENQIISAAYDLAERQIREGTASSQVITEFLKRGSSRERLEKKRIEMENKLTQAKIESLESQKKIEELYTEALKAMSRYSGRQDEDQDGDDSEN